MFRIYPYKMGSASVRKLADALEAKIIKLQNSTYRFNPSHTIINWGNSSVQNWMEGDDNILNRPGNVAVASNKFHTLENLTNNDIPTVPWTTSQNIAEQWLNDGNKIFVRKTLTGHSGEGIEVVEPINNPENNFLNDIATQLYERNFEALAEIVIQQSDFSENADIPQAPLYTRGISNHGEYRVHVFDGEVILYQKKSRRIDEETGEVVVAEGTEADVRNLASNWVYRTGNLRRVERIEDLAVRAVNALGLDFGAVDIIKDENGNVFVLEVNTAPGLGNTETLEAYVNAFKTL